MSVSGKKIVNVEIKQENRARDARVQARALLRSLVSQEQWTHWIEFSEIEIVGSEGTSFRLIPGSNGNITVFDENGDIERICAHPQLLDEFGAILPNEDVLAAQILALRTDEIGFRRIANVHRRFRAEVDELAA